MVDKELLEKILENLEEDHTEEDTKTQEKREKNIKNLESEVYYKQYLDYLKIKSEKSHNSGSETETEETESYSSDTEKYKKEVELFIEYVKCCTFQEEATFLYLERHKNQIKYGKMKLGSRVDTHIIDMISAIDLQEIYQQLKMEFPSSFKKRAKRTFVIGWQLLPMIGENVMIEINSDNKKDKKWFSEEGKNKEPIDIPVPDELKINTKKIVM